MKVFVTGATGFVGTAVVQELLGAGHEVLGLARSEESAKKLIEAGAEAYYGDLTDFESLKSGAKAADAVIHLGFVHDFGRFQEMCELDKEVINAIGDALVGTEKPFLITSGTALFSKDGITTEHDRSVNHPHPRIATENAADDQVAKGVNVAVIRLSPSVHGEGDKIGFVPLFIKIAKEKGVSAIIGDGNNHWPAVHRLDAAKLYRLALEKPFEKGTRYHAVAEEGIQLKKVATEIAERLNIPLVSLNSHEAESHFSWFTHFAKLDNLSSSIQTRKALGWNPVHPTLLEDLKDSCYFSEHQ
ncbi:Nucleoside-diphosphate-sugar epimerase [Chryseobacterium arachidis]|uniref:Nucleoside-diphosphate-sugar epimerase n=1 Tax=Chryseobacterium arachidis TaxID=1416778 RepID=A0A1M4V972_9FLAO|nr:SDR family oxidoreductase [Chryseobacterium arachidis]SHE65398.1 Nucleoside-diphosphate-sugar epimerase [Chryseobacterium arachidis]